MWPSVDWDGLNPLLEKEASPLICLPCHWPWNRLPAWWSTANLARGSCGRRPRFRKTRAGFLSSHRLLRLLREREACSQATFRVDILTNTLSQGLLLDAQDELIPEPGMEQLGGWEGNFQLDGF